MFLRPGAGAVAPQIAAYGMGNTGFPAMMVYGSSSTKRSRHRSEYQASTTNSTKKQHNPLCLAVLSLMAILMVVLVPLFLMTGPAHARRDPASVRSKGNTLTKGTSGGDGDRGSNVYRGKQYWKEGVTMSVETLYESPFARFQRHEIQLIADAGNKDTPGEKKIIEDWLWFDEPDNVNVLVEDEQGKFLVLEQTKYAIPEPSTYATVGGLIEGSDASPLEAAQREVREELHLEAPIWISLGHYVAAANRGGGRTHAFWARQAKPIATASEAAVVGAADLEAQHLLKLSKDQLLEALLEGNFREIKWTATVALALLSADKNIAGGT